MPLSDLPTEDAVLRAQAAAAHEAIAATLSRLKDNLKEAADVRVWTQRHPWIALGAAAAAGVAAAGMVKGPRKPGPEWAGNSTGAVHAGPETATATNRANSSEQDRSMFNKLFGGMFDLAATSLQHWLIGMVQAHFVSEAAGDAAREGTHEAAQETAGHEAPPENESAYAFH